MAERLGGNKGLEWGSGHCDVKYSGVWVQRKLKIKESVNWSLRFPDMM